MTNLTSELLAEARRVAEAASPGDWSDATVVVDAVNNGFGPMATDDKFVQLCCPTTTLALLGEIERLRQEREVLAKAYVDLRGGLDALRPWLKTAQWGDMKSCHNQAVILAFALLQSDEGSGDKDVLGD